MVGHLILLSRRLVRGLSLVMMRFCGNPGYVNALVSDAAISPEADKLSLALDDIDFDGTMMTTYTDYSRNILTYTIGLRNHRPTHNICIFLKCMYGIF